jgi:glycosyltransferase involved in cell wall biosynthesis
LSSDFESQLKSWGVSVPIFRETTCVQEELLKDFDIQIKWSKPGSVNPLKVLFLARLDKAKGAFETVNAFKLLGDKGFSVFLTIAGDGPIRNELQMLAKELGLNDKFIQFTGDIRGEKKINAFTEHHIYCFPTYFGEGLPTSVLEAMAFGMPVITRPVGGLKDFFENDKMGYFVETKDPVDIANCLERLLVDYNKMIKIGKYNYRYAQNNFMASVVARRLTAIYDNVLRRVA